MRQMFVNKVKETESELKEKEREVGVSETCEMSPSPTFSSEVQMWMKCERLKDVS